MDVKINSGAWTPNPSGKTQQQRKDVAETPFSALLHATGSAGKDDLMRGETDFSGKTAAAVFAQALDRSNPDLDSLDDYMDWLLKQ